MTTTNHDVIRLFHPSAKDRLAVVSVDAATGKPGQFVVQVARGKTRLSLTDVRMLGPFSAEELDKARKGIVDSLIAEGYVAAGLGQLLMALQEKNPRVRARAAQRLARRKEQGAVDPLLALLDKPKDDVATIVDALGTLGDPKAIPAVRNEAERKLLSRRRAGVEALRKLNDTEGLAAARTRALERLPQNVKSALEQTDTVTAIVNSIGLLDVKERGLAIDTVYELGHEEAARKALLADVAGVNAPHIWRYAKSVWKRALTRDDWVTVGQLTHKFEIVARTSKGTSAQLKSGYDGETKKTRVFSPWTVNYLRRRAWRALRALAKSSPEKYSWAAAECVVPYVDGDDVMKGNAPATGRSYLMHRILFGASTRYELNARNLRYRARPKGPKPAPASTAREEMFPELWDKYPRGYVRLLGGARHTLAQRFAVDAVTTRAPNALQSATHAEVAALLESDDARIVDLGLVELRRRFNPDSPDLDLVFTLAGSPRDLVRHHGLMWLNACAHKWTRDRVGVMRFLQLGHAEGREAAARLVVASVGAWSADDRKATTTEMLRVIAETKEPEEGAFAAIAEVLRTALLDDAAAQTPIAKALALVDAQSESAISVGAAILGKKDGALDVLGVSRVLEMAQHDKAAVRRASLSLLHGAIATLQSDPSVLFGLVESEWDDTRASALELLDKIDLGPLGLDGLIGLADSTRPDVQRKAQQLLNASMERLDVHELLGRLGQHPSRLMRAYAVDMAVKHLKPGFVRLAKLEILFRATLLDVMPDRKTKRAVIEFLSARGQQDENQAEVAAQILGDFVRTQTMDDRERALQALVKIQIAFPKIASPVVLA